MRKTFEQKSSDISYILEVYDRNLGCFRCVASGYHPDEIETHYNNKQKEDPDKTFRILMQITTHTSETFDITQDMKACTNETHP